jgi:hypothetical protein
MRIPNVQKSIGAHKSADLVHILHDVVHHVGPVLVRVLVFLVVGDEALLFTVAMDDGGLSSLLRALSDSKKVVK